MFIPLHDANSLKHIRLQFVTIAIIAINIIVYLSVNLSMSDSAAQAIVTGLGFIPVVAFDYRDLPPDLFIVTEEASYITYAFLHADFMHITTNMLFLWVFGDNVEDAMGHFRFLIFYVACAAAGAVAHGVLDVYSPVPLIGASGAVAGVIGAYLLLHPKVWVWVLALGRIPLRLPAALILVGWFGMQVYFLLTDIGGMVSWGAHVGGFVAGATLVLLMRRKGVPLFDREIVTPDAVVLSSPSSPSASSNPPPLPGRGKTWGR